MFISDQFLLNLEPDVDEHLYLPFVGTKHFKAFESVNSMLLSTWNSEYVLKGLFHGMGN